MNLKIGYSIVISLALILSIISCSKSSENSLNSKKIRLAVYEGESSALVYVAQDMNFFKQQGLNIKIDNYEAGKFATDALCDGKADISTASDSVLVGKSFQDENLRTFGVISTAVLDSLIARKDHGINTINDLVNKKIAVTKGSASEFFLSKFLIFFKIPIKNLNIIDLKPSDSINAILNGEVDAVFSWEPNIYKIKQKLGDKAIIWKSLPTHPFYFLLITNQEWLNNNSQSAIAFIKALQQSEEYINNNPKKFIQFIQNRFGYDKEYIDYSKSMHSYNLIMPQSLIVAMEDHAKWAIKRKIVSGNEMPNYLNFINTDILEKIKPGSVTIIK